jgi:hypothetical protein
MSSLSTSYKTFPNILLLRLTPYVAEIIGNNQLSFDVTGHIFYIPGILEKFKYNEIIRQLSIEFKNSVRKGIIAQYSH